MVSVTTGTGWYGEPFQHGRGTPFAHGVIRLASSAGGDLEQRAEPLQHGLAAVGLRLQRVTGSRSTTSVLRLVTSGRPRSSTIAPRGAARMTSRVCCRLAVWTSLSSSSTCR